MNKRIQQFEKYISEGMTTENMLRSLSLIGCCAYDEDTIEEMRIYSDFLPMMQIDPYTQEQRYLHILWEAIDHVPLGIDCGFSIPYRKLIAKKLFKKCGKGFIASPRCTFNYGHRIEVGDNVAWNMGCYFDSKGTVTFGNGVMIAENVTIFSHSHCSTDHMIREYKPVIIEDNAIMFKGCTILPGVRIGAGAVVAAEAVVTSDIPANMMAVGMPAVAKKEIDRRGRSAGETNHYFFANRYFQEE